MTRLYSFYKYYKNIEVSFLNPLPYSSLSISTSIFRFFSYLEKIFLFLWVRDNRVWLECQYKRHHLNMPSGCDYLALQNCNRNVKIELLQSYKIYIIYIIQLGFLSIIFCFYLFWWFSLIFFIYFIILFWKF